LSRGFSKVYRFLKKQYPNTKIALRFSSSWQLLVATMLSAQCTDKKVNEVTKELFKKYKKPSDYARLDLRKLEAAIRSTGFYKSKAKNLKKTAQIIVDKYNKKVPQYMDELVELPGIARKTANIILYNGFSKISGIAVDTHVKRVSFRLGLTDKKDPVKIEKDLMEVVPYEDWGEISYLLIEHGRNICKAVKPKCKECFLKELCRYYSQKIRRNYESGKKKIR